VAEMGQDAERMHNSQQVLALAGDLDHPNAPPSAPSFSAVLPAQPSPIQQHAVDAWMFLIHKAS